MAGERTRGAWFASYVRAITERDIREMARINSPSAASTVLRAVAALRYGLSRLPAGRRRSRLTDEADALFSETEDRLLTFDAKAADHYGELVAARELAGRPISVADAIIASIAWVHRATLATRNSRDFADCGLQVVNPYDF